MKGIIICSIGIEAAAAQDVLEMTGSKTEIREGCVIFDFKKFEDLCLLCYKSQSADRVGLLLGSFEFLSLPDEISRFIDSLDFCGIDFTNKKFKVECIRQGEHNFKSVDIEAIAPKLLKGKIAGAKADPKNFQILFLFYIQNNTCHLCVDFSGFELNKREYKIFSHPSSLRGTIAYALARYAGFKKKDVMLDPFSKDGIIPIECAFLALDFPCNYYRKNKFAFPKIGLEMDCDKFFESVDKRIRRGKVHINGYDYLFKYVDYSKKNAKIAGVDKFINFSRVELDLLDLKFKKGEIDRIITCPPTSKNINLDKIYNEFFYQASYILSSRGTISIISRIPDFVKTYASRHNLFPNKEMQVYSGEQQLHIIVFSPDYNGKSKSAAIARLL